MQQIDPQRLQTYRDLMDSLDPSGPPKAVYVSEPTAEDPRQPDRCLVLDATFNPPTVAHWELALTGARVSEADRILLQVSIANVDKSVSGADLGLRVYMVARLAAVSDHVGVSACSHARFVDKAQALHNLSPSTRHIFAVGFDTLIRVFDPKYYSRMSSELDELFSSAEFAVANRGGQDEKALREYLAMPPQTDYKANIHQVTLAQNLRSVSSSEIRAKIRAGGDVSDRVSSVILDIIRETGLYIK